MKTEIRLDNNRIFVKTPYAACIVDRFRLVPGRQFHKDEKEWSFPAVRDVILMVCDIVGLLPLFLPDDLRKIVQPAPMKKLELDLSILNGLDFVTRPYRHQKENLVRLLTNKRWLLADEMGTGKTKAIVDRLLFGAEFQSCLILCPKTVISSWLEQLQLHGRHLDRSFNSWGAGAGPFGSWSHLTNYEQLLFRDFTEHPWRTLILDEVHRLKNFTAKTTKIVRKLSAQAEHVYALSGTPAPNGLEDWLGVLSVVDPDLLPCHSKAEFARRYLIKEQLPDRNVWVTKGYRNVHELHGYISAVTSRVTKAECLDLPDKVIAPRYVKLEHEQGRIYRDIKNKAVARIKSLRAEGQLTVRNAITESLRLLQIVGGFVPDDDGVLHEIDGKAKMESVEDILDEAGDKQIVFWCHFREEVYHLRDWLLKTTKAAVSFMTGDSPDMMRQAAVAAFSLGHARYFVATTATGGLGINGLQAADLEVYYSRSWNLVDWLQSQDRLHRIGQKNQVTIIPLIAENTIDVKIDEVLRKKQDIQEMMLQQPEEMF